MVEFSGRVTAYAHKNEANLPEGGDWKDVPYKAPSAIQTETIFRAQWSDCPVEVEEEIKKLWRWQELRNDNCYFRWKRDEEFTVWAKENHRQLPAPTERLEEFGTTDDDGENYEIKLCDLFPLTDYYLMSKNIEECLINWWW